MNNEILDRQNRLGISPKNNIAIVGCGGIGVWVALFLALSGSNRLILYDHDRVEFSNLARIPFQEEDVNKPKVEVLASLLSLLRPSLNVEAMGKATELTLSTGGLMESLIDCTDNVETQLMIWKWCEKTNVPYMKAGYDGTLVTVTSTPSGWSTGSGVGYTITPSWVIPAVMAACGAVMKLYKPELEINGDILDGVRYGQEPVKTEKQKADPVYPLPPNSRLSNISLDYRTYELGGRNESQ